MLAFDLESFAEYNRWEGGRVRKTNARDFNETVALNEVENAQCFAPGMTVHLNGDAMMFVTVHQTEDALFVKLEALDGSILRATACIPRPAGCKTLAMVRAPMGSALACAFKPRAVKSPSSIW